MKYRVPLGIEFGQNPPQVRWQLSPGSRFTEPFFEDTLVRLRRAAGTRLPALTTPLHLWSEGEHSPRPAAVILHVSRCGSTLLSRMLASLPANLVISEARIFDDILRARRADPSISDEMRDGWLRQAVAAFVESQATPVERVVIKLDCWHIFEIQRLRRVFPGVPLLFVHRDPREVLVSLLQRPSLTLVRGTVTPQEIGVGQEQRDSLSPVELAAAILGAFFREAVRNREYLVSVPYTSLPAFVWQAIPGLQFSAQEVSVLREVAQFDAKEPRLVFVPDASLKQAAANEAVGSAYARWIEPAYRAWLSAL